MGYLHIDNLYRNQTLLMMKEVYALEKIHGTSAHLKFTRGVAVVTLGGEELSRGPVSKLTFYAGGESYDKFVKVFAADLIQKFDALGHSEVTVYGEAYGGKQQGMRETYGPELKFVVFDVRVGDSWLSVPQAADVAAKLGLEFVYFERIPTTEEALNAARDRHSEQAVRNGVGPGKLSEGVVLRPLVELTLNNGDRLIAKHKAAAFSERASKRDTSLSPEKAEVLAKADAIALEWVTEMRLDHVLDKAKAEMAEIGRPIERFSMSDTPMVIARMQADVEREGAGEFVPSREASAAIGKRTASLFKARVAKLQVS